MPEKYFLKYLVKQELNHLLCISFSRLVPGGFQEKERIHTVMEENEKLLEEKRDLLRKISEAEEMGSNGMRTASTVQHRYLNESHSYLLLFCGSLSSIMIQSLHVCYVVSLLLSQPGTEILLLNEVCP